MTTAPLGAGVQIADSSAWHRSRQPAARDAWRQAIAAEQIATCSIVRYELLFSTRTPDAYDALHAALSALRDIPITVSVQRAAFAAMRTLAQRGGLQHRLPLPDLLIAAAAQEAGFAVMHYDHHFDRLADVLNFESRWIAPPGTL